MQNFIVRNKEKTQNFIVTQHLQAHRIGGKHDCLIGYLKASSHG